VLAYNYSDEFFITTNFDTISISDIKRLLNLTHWACNRTPEAIKKSVDNSMCFGILSNDSLIGFARVITDYTTFAYLSDVVVDPSYRGKQLGHWLIKSIMTDPDLKDIKQWRLKTTYAHSFYKTLGFKELNFPENHLELCSDN